jgi:hypothetical protein
MSDPTEANRNAEVVRSEAAERVREMVVEQMDGLAEGMTPGSAGALDAAVAWVTGSLDASRVAFDVIPKLQAVFGAFELLASEIYLALATDRIQLAIATRTIASGSDFLLPKLARDIAIAHIEEMRRDGRGVFGLLDLRADGE